MVKALIFDETLRYVTDYRVPEPNHGEALTRVNLAGICNTDLEIIKGYLGFKGVLGHEFVGVVEHVNGIRQDLVGKRVVGEINYGCKSCQYCKSGLEKHCPDRKTLGISKKDGAFAEYLTIPFDNLYAIPDSIADEEAVFVEPLAAAFEITEQIHIKPIDKILIIGDGKLGLLIAFVLRLIQADITLLGRHENKLNIARVQGIKTKTLGEMEVKKVYDTVIDATGAADGIELAMRFVKPRGILVLKTTVAHEKNLNLSPIVIDEITIVGSRCGPFLPAILALSKGDINVKPLITSIYKAERALDGFELAKSKTSLKVILDFR